MTAGQIELADFVVDFARAVVLADRKVPVAVNSRSGLPFQPGLGPHSESAATVLIAGELRTLDSQPYMDLALSVPYPETPRQRCDLCLGTQTARHWAIEIKLVRLLGDNGKLNDNMIMHLLSPYAEHRSAVTDCTKLAASSIAKRKAILIYGFEDERWPLEPLISSFEVLAGKVVKLGPRLSAGFQGLIHPIHRQGGVFGWEIL